MGYVLDIQHPICSDTALGHARPLSILITRFVKLHPALNVTLFTHDAFLERVKAEIARGFEPDEQDYAKRIR